MNAEEIFILLDSNDGGANQKETLRLFLLQQVQQNSAKSKDMQHIAYKIAGLLNTRFAASLKEGDPFLQVLLLAGELELPDRHRSGATWERFETLVKALPN